MMGRIASIRSVWVALTLAAAFIGPASSPIGLPDIFWTLLSGDWMIDHRALLEADPFTSAPHAPGPLLDVQWLAQLIFAGLDRLGGLPLVITGTAVAIALAYGLVLAASVCSSGHLRLSCVTVWAAYVLGFSNLNPRPQSLAYPLFGLFVLAVSRAEWRHDTRLLWLLPVATVVWANVHGSFFVGFILLGCAAVGRALATRGLSSARAYALTLLGCGVASLVNPYGAGSLVYVASMGSNPIIRDAVTEWAPTTVNWREGILFFLSLALLAGVALKSRARLSPFEVLTLLAFGYLGWSSVRAIVWWGLVLAPILARLSGSLWSDRRMSARDRPAVNAAILAGILGMVLVSLPWIKTTLPLLPADKRGLFTDDTPVRLGEYLGAHEPPPGAAMFNDQGWGGYLEWALWPRRQVFLDGRIELHPPGVWFDYLDIVFPSARWQTLLDQYHISYLVLDLAEHPDLVALVRGDPDWRLDYEDDQAAVFSKLPWAAP